MAKRKWVSWQELADMVCKMGDEEKASPVLLCMDDGYFGVEPGNFDKVPDDVDKDVCALDPIKSRHVVAGRTFLVL